MQREAPDAVDAGPTSPERSGIFFGWYIVAAGVGLYTLAGGILFYGFPVFFDAILEDYTWSKAAAALAFAAVQFEGGAASPIWGWVVDRFGTRAPMVAGTVLMAAGFWVLSGLDSLLVFYLGFAMAGIGYGVYFTAPMASISNWFEARRTLAMGIAMCGYGLSGALAPVLNWGINGYGWRTAFVASSIATLAIGIPLCLLLRRSPEPYGYGVDGGPVRPRAAAEGAEPAGPAFSAGQAMRTSAFWLLSAFIVLYWIGFTGMVPHMVTYLKDVGIAEDIAVLAITGTTIATLIGRVVGGALADRIGKRPVLLGGFLVLAIGVLLFAAISHTWQLVLFVIVMGPALGALIPIVPALIADYFGTRSFALIFGLIYVPTMLTLFGVPSAVGWVFDRFGTYRPAWVVLGLVTLVAVPLVFKLRAPALPDSEPATQPS